MHARQAGCGAVQAAAQLLPWLLLSVLLLLWLQSAAPPR